MRPHGRAQVNPEAPRAFAVCDRCAVWYNHYELRFQLDYRGLKLQNLRILVCERCYDDPQPQLKPKLIGPDPLPVLNARPESFYVDETDLIVSDTGDFYVTDTGLNIETHTTSIRPGSSTVTGMSSLDFIDKASMIGTVV